MPAFYQPVAITTSTFTVTKDHAGVMLELDRAAGSTITLPAVAGAVGQEFHFVVKTAPTGDYAIGTSGGADIIVIGVNELEVDTGDDGPYDDNADVVTFKANVAVVGDYIKLRSDGTKWYGYGQTNADGGITTATT